MKRKIIKKKTIEMYVTLLEIIMLIGLVFIILNNLGQGMEYYLFAIISFGIIMWRMINFGNLKEKFIIQLQGREKNMAYKEINPEIWSYEKDGDFIEGVLVLKEPDVGENKSWMYSIETSEGEVKNVWGSAILDSRMKLVKVGNKIKITYKGLGEGKAGRSPPKIFKVEVDTE